MGFFKEGPLTIRQGGWFLVAVGSFLLYLGFVSPLVNGQVPLLFPGMPGCVFGVAFLGTGLPFALLGNAATSTFGHPQKPDSWPRLWGVLLVAVGLLAFMWLRWHSGA